MSIHRCTLSVLSKADMAEGFPSDTAKIHELKCPVAEAIEIVRVHRDNPDVAEVRVSGPYWYIVATRRVTVNGVPHPPCAEFRFNISAYSTRNHYKRPTKEDYSDQDAVSSFITKSFFRGLDDIGTARYGITAFAWDDPVILNGLSHFPAMGLGWRGWIAWHERVHEANSPTMRLLDVYWANYLGPELQTRLPANAVDEYLALKDVSGVPTHAWAERYPNGGLAIAISNNATQCYGDELYPFDPGTFIRNGIWLKQMFRSCGLM